jgi:hypothetical protein
MSKAAIFMVVVFIAIGTVHAGDLPKGPDGAVKEVLERLADRQPEVLWQALPPSYQDDITELTHAFAAKMDPELWDAIFQLGEKAVGVLRDKKPFILESSMMQAAGDRRDEVEENWDSAVAVMDSLFSSEVSNLDNLKAMDWERFLKTSGAEIMNRAAESSAERGKGDEDFIAELQQTKVELIDRDGDSATVRLSAPDEEPEEVALLLVEGRWVPADMAKDWDTDVAEAKRDIEAVSEEELANSKMQVMMFIGMADAVLDQLAAVNSTEEFEQAMESIGSSFRGMVGG